MENKKPFLMYADQNIIFNNLTDEEAGKLIKLIFSYVNDENPDIRISPVRMPFLPIMQQLKRDLRKYEARCLKNLENIQKRWGKDKDTTVYERIPSNTNHTDNDNGTENDTDKVSILSIEYHLFKFIRLKNSNGKWLEIKNKEDPLNKGVVKIYFWDEKGIVQSINKSQFEYYDFK